MLFSSRQARPADAKRNTQEVKRGKDVKRKMVKNGGIYGRTSTLFANTPDLSGTMQRNSCLPDAIVVRKWRPPPRWKFD
jgi:hypothetical protein